MLNIGMGCVERLGHRIDIVTAFGHSHGHNPDIRLRHARDQGRVIGSHRNEIDHGACHFGGNARRVQFDQRVQIVLFQQFQTTGFIVRTHACAHDGPIQCLTVLHQPVQIPRLMGAVEITQTDVNDARRQRASVVGRNRDVHRQIRQGFIIEFHHRGLLHSTVHQLIQFPPSTPKVCATT